MFGIRPWEQEQLSAELLDAAIEHVIKAIAESRKTR